MMRHALLALLLATSVSPAVAQSGAEDLNRRVDRLERELRAVQRNVFPGGAGTAQRPGQPPLQPEITANLPPITPSGVPASSALADLTSRIDALESQLRTLTGQSEENAHRLMQMERALADFRSATEGRLAAIEKPEPAAEPEMPAASTRPSRPANATADPVTGAEGDPAEAAYIAGFRQWEAKNYTEAQKTLEAWVKKYPRHPRGSFARNLLGRAYLDGGKPAAAAKVLLENYETNPNGERAPDSLLYLGQALVEAKLPDRACGVYEQLESEYGPKLRAALKQELPKARAAAKCR